MSSGKSSVAKIIADKTNLKYYDLDKLIEESEQKSISDIFKDSGEIYFRKTESVILKEVLQLPESFVLALGGGTPCYANNHELLQDTKLISIYLKTSVEVLVSRLKHNKSTRPLIAGLSEDELQDYVRKHLFDRGYYYHQAQYIVSTDNKTTQAIAEEVLLLSETHL